MRKIGCAITMLFLCGTMIYAMVVLTASRSAKIESLKKEMMVSPWSILPIANAPFVVTAPGYAKMVH